MKTLAVILFLGVLLGVSKAASLRQLIGLCVEACSTVEADGEALFGSCPEGYVCRSNGCGHTCQKPLTSVECPLLRCLDIYCPSGYYKDAQWLSDLQMPAVRGGALIKAPVATLTKNR
ncbi:uncharacterized protein LOC112557276 isoform X1 [Pomacea canaliculata]|uniref:uncharacterized protein LOC112557276 isoform X1 n=1 Tax=Pomacea canaliculata TaxID=400727 RepID=UPI000D72CF3A|nr:uncharacterized protein LOC112557276 isoform X1 [Pomacea canaliculata]